jgi:DNA-binding LacI/PurR family transcriptional regulator
VSTVVNILLYRRPSTFYPVLEALILHLQRLELTPVPVVFEPDNPAALQQLASQWRAAPPRGVIVKGPCMALRAAIKDVPLPHTRFMTISRAPTDAEDWHNVRPNEDLVYFTAAKHLVSKGHRRIGLVYLGFGPEDLAQHEVGKGRSVRRVFEESGLPPGLTVCPHTLKHDNLDVQVNQRDVDAVAAWLTGPDRPTAVIEHIERLVLYRLAARQAGLILGVDIDVVGVGDPPANQPSEFLCVGENNQELARCAASLIVSTDPELDRVARHIVVPPRLDEIEKLSN